MKIVLGISSGIAAYKIGDLAKNLVSYGHDVHVVMTEKSTHLIDPVALEDITGHTVYRDLFPADFSKEKILHERKVDHIELAKSADIIVIAPATANTIANLAAGKADDFLSTTVLATRAPILVCPSMNDQMWLHPSVQANLQKLESYGYTVMTPATGALACGTDGIGRLPDIEDIENAIDQIINVKKNVIGKKILITAGGSTEPIDDVRVLSNRSSGKMGIALARECHNRGAEVLLLLSHTSIPANLPFRLYTYRSSSDLARLLEEHIQDYEYIFHTAAVSDFTVAPFPGKIDSGKEIILTLKPTEKIINQVKLWNPTITLIGFKAISGTMETNQDKIERFVKESRADYVVVNDISRADIGFESDDNEVTILDKNGNKEMITKRSKKDIAKVIIERIMI